LCVCDFPSLTISPFAVVLLGIELREAKQQAEDQNSRTGEKDTKEIRKKSGFTSE
jgi:hypothetical protein